MSTTTFVLLWVVIMVAVFYFTSYKPSKKREQEQQAMQNALKPGDKVTTIGGIMGTVVEKDDESVFLLIDGETGATIRMVQKAVSMVRVKAEDNEDWDADEDEDDEEFLEEGEDYARLVESTDEDEDDKKDAADEEEEKDEDGC